MRLLVALVPWALVVLFLIVFAMAVGFGQSFGSGLPEWMIR